MGLSIFVGILADVQEHDSDGYDHYKGELEAVNPLLARAGLPAHHEPELSESWSAEMFGYSGLHALRRVAAHLDLSCALPPPGDKESSKDPVLEQYRSGGFDHLLLHSDAEGFYIPIDFADVLVDGDTMVGSSQRLLRECEHLRDALGIPADIDPEDTALWDAADAQGQGTGWQRYGIEAFTCVRLLHGAKRSIEQRAALVFG